MASRAEAAAVPRWPGVGSAFRAALVDFYLNSLRFVAANLVWGATLIAVWLAYQAAAPGALLLPLLAFPTASIFRMAALVVRGESVSWSDGLRVWRTEAGPVLLLGIALVGAATLFVANIVNGVSGGGVLGWVIATAAAWGALMAWLVSWAAWPLLLDPARADRPVRERLRLAVLLVLAYPLRMALLGVTLAVIVLVSSVAVIALMTISVSFAALVATRYVLPAADRLEERMRP